MQNPTINPFVCAALFALLLPTAACQGAPPSNTEASAAVQQTTTPVATAATPATPAPPVVPARPDALPAPDDVAAAPGDAARTATGLAYKVLKAGTGTRKPSATDTVQVHYTGWTVDGSMFDSSVVRARPASFPLNRVIKGWTEGVQLMVEGEKTRFWIPPELAYGTTPQRPGAPAGMLVFDVELLSIQSIQ